MEKLSRQSDEVDLHRPYIHEPLAPGRSTVTSRHVMRKERDGQGVTADADAAVERASSSSGDALPGELRSRFETSTGADLSSVRIHRSAVSNDAADAVGAKAYTVGQDIHFAQGHYDPSSAAGQELIAHEVAHTVQQQGSVARRMHKLEVSTPGDAYEIEADAAASAMVQGRPAAIGLGLAGLGRKTVQRDITDSEFIREQQADKLKQYKPPTVLTGMTVTADVSRCDDIIGKIDDARGGLGQLKGAEDGMAKDHDGEKDYIPQARATRAIETNKGTRKALEAMREGAQKQQFDHGFFEPQYQTLSTEFVRLQSAVEVIKGSSIDVTGAAADVAKVRNKNPIVNAKLETLGTEIRELQTLGGKIPEAVTGAEAAFRSVTTKIDGSRLPLPVLQDTSKQADANAKVAKVNADLADAKGAISTIQATVTTAMTLYGGPATMAAINGMVDKAKAGIDKGLEKTLAPDDAKAVKTGGEKALDKGGDSLKEKLAESMSNYQARIARASGECSELKAQIKEFQGDINARELADLQVTLSEQVNMVIKAITAFEAKKEALTKLVQAIEAELKKMGGSASHEVAAAIQLTTDVARFDAQADVTIALGEKEQANAKDAEKGRKDAAGDYAPGAGPSAFSGDTEIAATQGGRSYWSCEVSRGTDAKNLEDLSGFKLEEHPVIFNVQESDKRQHSQVMSDAVGARLEEVRKWKAEAAEFKTKIEAVLNIQT